MAAAEEIALPLLFGGLENFSKSDFNGRIENDVAAATYIGR